MIVDRRALAIPGGLFAVAFCLLPLALLIGASFRGESGALHQYSELFTNPTNLRIFADTCSLAVKVTALTLLLGFPTALFLARLDPAWRNVGLMLILLPYLTSFLVRTYAWTVILADNGLLNGALLKAGLIRQPLPLLYHKAGVLIGMTHIMLPFMVLLLVNTMMKIDTRVLRAAASLGSSPTRTFLRVFLPLTAPGIRSGCILVFALCLGFYITPLALGSEREITLAALIENRVFRMVDFGFASAAATVLLLLTCLLFALPGTDPAVGALGGTSGTASIFDSARESHERLTVGRMCTGVFAVSVLIGLIVPTVIVVPMSFNGSEFLGLPREGLSLRWYENFFSDARWLSATWLSLKAGLASTALATVLGTAAALALAGSRLPGKRLLIGLLVSPLIVPAVVLGLALYGVFVHLHLLGTLLGITCAHAVVGTAYVYLTVSASLAQQDPALARAAHSLGASPLYSFHSVTLPLIAPGVFTGALFAFVHSFDEVVVTLFVAGHVTRTLPLKMWENVRHEIDPTLAAISSLLLFASLLALTGLQWRTLRARRVQREKLGAA
ncbi:MAG: ABC transporter permease subunit [Gammaproteobacteria bacterium]